MTDRELLELAAKAAGIDLFEGTTGHMLSKKLGRAWNPLEDDGDAFRLMVKLKLSVHVEDGISTACSGEPHFVDEEVIDTDHHKATRSAIVRAAAEIGRNME